MSMIEWKLRGIGGMTLATGVGVILPPQVQAQIQQSKLPGALQQTLWQAAAGGPTTGSGSGAPPPGTPQPDHAGTLISDITKADTPTPWGTYFLWGGLALAALVAGGLAISVLRK